MKVAVRCIVIVCLMFWSCNSKKEVDQSKPLNILWINIDDLGRELGCYGNPDVKTPYIDELALQGVLYANAYANAPVCSASRSSQITGMYPSTINALNHRTMEKQNLPNNIVPIMQLFREKGYFCTNGKANNMEAPGKTDYNFLGENLFDGTDWEDRADGQPFFAQVQIKEPHRVFADDTVNPVDPKTVTVPECYPNHPLIRADWAKYLESIQIADKRVGKILKRLDEEGLSENTVVMLFGDHGRPHLRDKQWLYEGGLAIPLIVRYPTNNEEEKVKDDLISLVDVAASTLKIANIPIPEYMHGKAVLSDEKRDYVFGFRQRCGDAVDDIRSITDGRYKLIWNRMPQVPYMQLTSYKKLQYPAFTLYKVLHKNGELEHPYSQFMAETKPEIELFDLKEDPMELKNLARYKDYWDIRDHLFLELSSKINAIEKNVNPESPEAEEKAKQGSHNFLLKGLEKKGLPADASDTLLLEHWEEALLE